MSSRLPSAHTVDYVVNDLVKVIGLWSRPVGCHPLIKLNNFHQHFSLDSITREWVPQINQAIPEPPDGA